MRKQGMLPLALVAVMLALPASAGASTITVDTTVDGAVAATNDGNCGLREAITAANTNAAVNGADDCSHDGGAGDDTVNFAAAFNGEAADKIVLGSALPDITGKLALAGGDCDPGPAPKPCVEVEASGLVPVLLISGTSGSSVRGLALTNGSQGVSVEDSATAATIGGNWLGVKLDGTSDPNQFGVTLLDTTSGTTIGGVATADRNVFYANTLVNLSLSNSDNNVIRGNWFGVLPDGSPGGSTPPTNVELTGSSVGTRPDNNVIGAADATTPGVCDLGCNVIARATGGGIQLSGGGSAAGTTIEGNFIGLDPTGTLDQGNQSGVSVGTGDNTTIGGAPASRNYIGGNAVGIHALSGSSDLTVENNFIGLAADGASAIADDDSGVDLSTSVADVTGNRFAGNGTDPTNGLRLRSSSTNATVQANEFGTDSWSLGFGGAAIVAGGDSHEIGGATAADANEISNTSNGAIQISGDGSDGNEVLRNLGSGNAALFADLTIGPSGFGNPANGPNVGIQAPAVKSARRGADRIKGTGVAGTTVRVYRSEGPAGTSPSGLLKFLGEKVVGPAGKWKINPVGKLKKGSRVSANQTSASDGSSEFARARKVKP